MSFAVPGYSGMLYQKGNSKTPLLTSIMGRQKFSNSVKFALGQEYVEEEGVIPEISESASMTAPEPTHVATTQRYNVTQIFQEGISISDAKQSNMGTLSGINVSGQVANPANQLDFQIARKMSKIRNSIEKTFIQGEFNEATLDTEVNKTRGLVQAITTNVFAAEGAKLNLYMIDRLLATMDNNGADVSDITLLADKISGSQLVANAIELGVPLGEAYTTAYGLQVRDIICQNGIVHLMTGKYLPAGTVLFVDLKVVAPVGMIVPGKGNFYLEELGKKGAGESYHIFGQMGLDYGMEFLHGKITGLSTDYAEAVGRKVITVAQA
jgi:hypothetical protein